MSSSPLRLPWVDHLRTLVILLVVNMHACVTYSHVGDWYIKSEYEPSLAAKVPFILWQAGLQSFFMSLLFSSPAISRTGRSAGAAPLRSFANGWCGSVCPCCSTCS